MNCIAPSAFDPSGPGNSDGDHDDTEQARQGLSRVLKAHFSSTPIDNRSDVSDQSTLTTSERSYLSRLLKTGDLKALEQASTKLKDESIFPPISQRAATATSTSATPTTSGPVSDPAASSSIVVASEVNTVKSNNESELPPESKTSNTSTSHHHHHHVRRNSLVQQQLFKLHQAAGSKKPSQLLSRMSYASRNSFQVDDAGCCDPTNNANNNTSNSLRTNSILASAASADWSVGSPLASISKSFDNLHEEAQVMIPEEEKVDEWNPFEDVSSWLDGSEGIEVSEEQGIVDDMSTSRSPRKKPVVPSDHFQIFGTSGDDISCHPHVLSPPLMESLSSFLPEGLAESNFWLKYSMVRDGANFWTLLRHVRASPQSILAVETTDGQVLGAFTSNSWRLAQGWYGSKSADAFLFKMRHSRMETAKSIVEQACQESEIQVFPYRDGNVAVQFCSATGGLRLGQAELLEHPNNNNNGDDGNADDDDDNRDDELEGHAATAVATASTVDADHLLLFPVPTMAAGNTHYGCGLCIEANLRHGHTSNSETFGNPCLTDASQRGARFDIGNIEIWTLTNCRDVDEAEQSELSALFLEGGRDKTSSHLNVLDIMTGGAI